MRYAVALTAAAAIFVALAPAAGSGVARACTGCTMAVAYTTPASLAAAVKRAGGRVLHRVPALRVAEVELNGDARAAATRIRRAPGIRYVEHVAPRATSAEPAVAASSAGVSLTWPQAATHADAVAPSLLRAAAAVTIAVVDTGADVSAPDLAAKAPTTWSVVTGSSDVTDSNGHGTFVASIAAGAIDDGGGVSGFGGEARLLVVQANRDGSFSDVDEAAAIVWAVNHGARIVNLSLTGTSTSKSERAALTYAAARGVLLVAAAGNDYRRGNPVEYPAALIQPLGSRGVGGRGLVVAASTSTGARAPFSSAGSFVSLAAPGVDVLGAIASTAPAAPFARVALPASLGGAFGLGSGTSYAAPAVSGAAALVWAANPLLTAAQVAAILKETASGHGRWNSGIGWGVIDVAAAVARAAR